MTAHPDGPRPTSRGPLEFDRAATRLSEVLGASCNPDLDFATQIEASLSAALVFLALEPQLADRLTALDPAQPDVSCYGVWIKIYARQLRRVAERSTRPFCHPDFVEPFLVAGISTQIRRSLDRGSLQDPGLLAGLKEFVLAYYSVTAGTARSHQV